METPQAKGGASITVEKESKKSASYPAITVTEAIDFVTKIYTELGHTQYHSRESISAVHRLAVTTTKQPLSTCQQYGLLELKHGVGYKVTPLFIKIYRPKSDKEKAEAILECFYSSEIYTELLDEFKGHVVPSLTGLSNILIRDHQIQANVSKKVADIFIDNLKTFSLLNDNNVLVLNPAINNTQDNTEDIPVDDSTKLPNPLPPKRTPYDCIEIPIPLKSSSGKAILIIPENFTDEDLERISKFVDALK